MPTYDYQCKECGHLHEEFHKMSENPRIKCPECGAKCKRLIGNGAGVIFKGGGWPGEEAKQNSRLQKHLEKDPENRGDGSGRILGDDP